MGRGRTGDTVPCRGERGSGTEGFFFFAWCLSDETSRVSSRTQTALGGDKSTSHFLFKCQRVQCWMWGHKSSGGGLVICGPELGRRCFEQICDGGRNIVFFWVLDD